MMGDVEPLPRIDIAQVKEQEIPEGEFPAPYPACDFRVHISPDAHDRIIRHAFTDTSVELCGVLVGRVLRDRFGPFALVEGIIEGEHAENRGAQVTFTHETWAHIFHELDSRSPDRQILGWYHTHPRFGVFLSPMDVFIQEHFFNLPWQVAFVVDPVSRQEGLFEWRDGHAVLAPQYWVGDQVHFGKQGTMVCVPKQEPAVQSAAPAVLQEATKERQATPSGGQAAPPVASSEVLKSSSPSLIWNITNFTLLLLILGVLLFRPQVEGLMQQFVLWIRSIF
jgi:proteasome lid subunit RPN8/RPN11